MVQSQSEIMKCILPLLAFMSVLLSKATSASIPTYQLEEDIKTNLIQDDDTIDNLHPPKLQAQDFFNLESGRAIQPEYPFIVEISRDYLKLKTTGFPFEIIKLTTNETEGVQRLSLAFVELLNDSKLSSQSETEAETLDWKSLNPIITLTHSGLTIRFLNTQENTEEASEELPVGERKIVWDFLAKYASNVLEEKLKDLNITRENEGEENILWEESSDEATSFKKFADALWRIMRLSVDYAEEVFEGWTLSPQTTTEEKERLRSTTTTLFAYEEPSLLSHEFPSVEFEKRRRDIDSIFYGRGII